MTLTAERARELLVYDPATGALAFRCKRGCRPAGAVVDHIDPASGYLNVRLDKKLYRAHRVIWLMVHGVWPQQIDHRNRDRADNRMENLRETCDALNRQNTEKARTDSRAGLKGVYMPRRSGGKYGARIRVAGKYIWLGQFDTADAAHRAYLDAKAQLHPAWEPSDEALQKLSLSANHLMNGRGERRVRSDSVTGHVGIAKHGAKWRARFKRMHLGVFATFDQALSAFKSASAAGAKAAR